MKKLDEILSKLTYAIVLGLVGLLIFLRPVQMHSQSSGFSPSFHEAPLIWWPIDNVKLYIAFGVIMAAIMYYRRAVLSQWPGRHIATVGLAVVVFGFTYVKTLDSYIAGYADRVEISHSSLMGKDLEIVPMRKIAEVRLSCSYKELRGRPLIEPAYVLNLTDGRQIDLFNGYKGNNREATIAGIARIDGAIRKSGAERLAGEDAGPGTPSFDRCTEEMKTRVSPESYDLFQKFMVKTADKSTFLRTL